MQSSTIGVAFSGFGHTAIDPDENAKCDENSNAGDECNSLDPQGVLIVASIHDRIQFNVALACDGINGTVAEGEGEERLIHVV